MCNTDGIHNKLEDVSGVMEPTFVAARVVPSAVRMVMGLMGLTINKYGFIRCHMAGHAGVKYPC